MNVVYYLCCKDTDQLVYPQELDFDDYVPGTWYISGSYDTYIFCGIHGDEIVPIELKSIDNIIYQADVLNVGTFTFKAEDTNAKYTGIYPIKNKLRILNSIDPASLDKAVMDHDFYFIGYKDGTN